MARTTPAQKPRSPAMTSFWVSGTKRTPGADDNLPRDAAPRRIRGAQVALLRDVRRHARTVSPRGDRVARARRREPGAPPRPPGLGGGGPDRGGDGAESADARRDGAGPGPEGG